MDKLNQVFVSSVATKKNTMKRLLEMYLSLGRIKSAENICQVDIIKPVMESILNENYLRNCKGGLKELYNQCYTFLQGDLKNLLQAAADQNNEYISHTIVFINY
jgi:hypothetical protein